jgi:hypothetical protein
LLGVEEGERRDLGVWGDGEWLRDVVKEEGGLAEV